MLSPTASVETLNPIRHQDFRQHVEQHMGETEAYYFEKATPDMVDQMIHSYYNKGEDEDVESNKTETLLFTVSKEWLEYQMQQALLEEDRRQSTTSAGEAATNVGIEVAKSASEDTPDENKEDDTKSSASLRPAEVVLSWWFNISGADFG
ncbi:MAG: hypothetical protein SGARI_007886, partial [Bacillariaceae sp.]